VDGELDLMKTLEIDQHFQECSACAGTYADLQALRSTIKEGAPYFEAPAGPQNRIRSSVRDATRAGPTVLVRPPRSLAVAASLLMVLITGGSLLYAVLSGRAGKVDSDERFVLASYVRSEMLPAHRLDVESSNQHTVKPWFAGKIDFAPLVPDLSDQGFSLIGGRLDYLDNRGVAVLVYQRRKHIIDLFIRPSAEAAEATSRAQAFQGYHLFHWSQAGMTYWAVSDLNLAELQEFVQQVQQKAR
jgi:anti-sigma factor RsiW